LSSAALLDDEGVASVRRSVVSAERGRVSEVLKKIVLGDAPVADEAQPRPESVCERNDPPVVQRYHERLTDVDHVAVRDLRSGDDDLRVSGGRMREEHDG
jgi:hypothetical protein